MKKFKKLRKSFNKVGKPIKKQVKKVENIKWLLPGWVFYEYYNLHKGRGQTNKKSVMHGVRAEASRLAAMASLPLPGTYELTTTGLALIKKKIEKGEIDKVTLQAFKDFTPLNKIKADKNILTEGRPYLAVLPKKGNLYFRIFYKNK